MSTIKCPDCGRKISSRTAFNHCPYCGCPTSDIVKAHKNRKRWTIIVIVAIVAIGYFRDSDKDASDKRSSGTHPVEQVVDDSHVKNTSQRRATRNNSESEVAKDDDGSAFEPSPIVENTASEELKALRESSMEVSLSDLDDSLRTILE